jgi:hypothetical protein
MGAEQSHGFDASSSGTPVVGTPTTVGTQSATSTPDEAPSETYEEPCESPHPDPLHAFAMLQVAATPEAARNFEEEEQPGEQLPSWAITPILPKTPKRSMFSLRSPLKDLRQRR